MTAAAPIARVAGIAVVFARDDIDTDQLFPARFLASGDPGAALFGSERYVGESRDENPQFVLNREPWRHARVLVAGRNFGCGSSREHAVWALRDFGIGAVIAESFNEIFRDNCLRNGVVPAMASAATVQRVAEHLRSHATATVCVDLAGRTIEVDGAAVGDFEIPAIARRMLMQGQDEIGLALGCGAQIERFERRDRISRPWLWRSARAP